MSVQDMPEAYKHWEKCGETSYHASVAGKLVKEYQIQRSWSACRHQHCANREWKPKCDKDKDRISQKRHSNAFHTLKWFSTMMYG